MRNIVLTAIALFGTQFAFAQTERNVGDFNSLKVYDNSFLSKVFKSLGVL